ADRNRSHWSTSKTPSYTKSVSWQHHPALPSLLVSGMPEWQVHNQSDKHLQSWYCRQLRSALLFHEPRIAALQVNLKEAYSHTLAISLEIMLYHDDEPLTFDLVWDNGGWRSATLENVS
ncbi:anti-adapter protein IraD, partial [Escherichia coli]|nr:anti-adapter protein IraD [Escherichia coli]